MHQIDQWMFVIRTIEVLQNYMFWWKSIGMWVPSKVQMCGINLPT